MDAVARVRSSSLKKPSILIDVSPIENLETSRRTGKLEPIAGAHEEKIGMCTVNCRSEFTYSRLFQRVEHIQHPLHHNPA